MHLFYASEGMSHHFHNSPWLHCSACSTWREPHWITHARTHIHTHVTVTQGSLVVSSQGLHLPYRLPSHSLSFALITFICKYGVWLFDIYFLLGRSWTFQESKFFLLYPQCLEQCRYTVNAQYWAWAGPYFYSCFSPGQLLWLHFDFALIGLCILCKNCL